MNDRSARYCGLLLCTACLLAHASSAFAQTVEDLSAGLKKLVDQGERAPESVFRAVTDAIERNPQAASAFLLPKTQRAETTEEELLIYVWAIGITGVEAAVDDIIALVDARGKESAALEGACLQALARIGGSKAGKFVLGRLETATDDKTRFNLLNLLGEMQYEPALPKAIEILKVDPERLYWQPIFVFGKMGDAAIPALIDQINSDEQNVRINAIMLLGIWLIAPEASGPLQERFWKEDDPAIRRLILSSLERTVIDLAELGRFSRTVVEREKEEGVRQFARETIDYIDAQKARIGSAPSRTDEDAEVFRIRYTELWKSLGKDGVIGTLEGVSRLEDEPRLKKLRERILCRDSDEAFYDYQAVNAVILKNRRAFGNPATQPTSAPALP